MQRLVWLAVVALAALGLWLISSGTQPPGPASRTHDTATPEADAPSRETDGDAPGMEAAREPTADDTTATRNPAQAQEDGRRSAVGGTPRPVGPAGAAISDSGASTLEGPRPGTGAGTAAPVNGPGGSASTAAAASEGADAAAPGPRVERLDGAEASERSDSGGRGSASAPVDDATLDYLARRSAGENASEARVNEHRGLAETLLSGESQEVRDRAADKAERAAE